MDHASLEIFCAVAEEASVTRAARRLGRAQSNVTTRIQMLEEELGAGLFLREGRRMRLSAQGEVFLGYARRLLALAEQARQALHPDRPQGSLRLGAMESTAASRLPGPLAEYHRRWPEVALRLATAPSRQLIEAVQARSLDAALVALPPAAQDEAPFDLAAHGLAGRPAWREELMLVLPPDHPPVQGPAQLAVRSLAAFPPGCSYRAYVQDWLHAAGGHGWKPFDVQEVGSYHAMLACVASGACLSVIPRSVVALAREPAVRMQPLAEVDTWLVWRQGWETPAFAALRDVLLEPADRPWPPYRGESACR